MASKVKLKNNIETEFEKVHNDNRTAKSVSSTDIAVDTVAGTPCTWKTFGAISA